MLTYEDAIEMELINEEALRFDNPSFDSAIIGVDCSGRLIYDFNKMVAELVDNDDMSEEEAIDFIEYNTIRSLPYFGEYAPIVLTVDICNDSNIKRGKSNDIMNYHVNRKTWQILWDSTLGEIGFGDNDGSHFENDVFECKAYRWWDNDDDVEYNKYHFWHKPSGFKIQWYKYALRGAECNMKISDNQFVDILYDCTNSLEEGKKVRFLHDVDKWWEESDNIDE